jgi:alkanesulfonate monooxygenase SsuD/methylene tetrahydromethanopterin reductase-like flavin-dependent oxidoreductase (luciferase family)
MKFGIATFVTDDGIGSTALARAIEERGFEFIAVAEHTHIPAGRQTPFPLGGALPEPYYRTLDPFVTLAAAAAVTSTIELSPPSPCLPSVTRSSRLKKPQASI